ncbi:MAG: hypothetical protein CMP10_04975 [Zetaproteobacteria bacterium]|nr:hypothetical protein [Pseudobdellovibrionaceae bacterium]
MKDPFYYPGSEERRRLFEFVAMLLTTIVLVGLSRLEGNLFELSDRLSKHKDFLTSVVYFGLINLNVILILVLGFLIFRNVIKLVVERKRGVIGSRLRTKLVVTLIFFAVAPTALLFYVSTRFITESFDTWFSDKVESTMHRTREAGALVYKRDKRRMESLARIALQRVQVIDHNEKSADPSFISIDPTKLHGFVAEYRLDSVKLFDRFGALIWDSKEGKAKVERENINSFVLISLDRFAKNPGMLSRGAVEVEDERDIVKGIAPIFHSATGSLVGVVLTEEHFETQIIRSVEAILHEFAELRPRAQLIRLSYTILLVVMVLIIVFSATWLGFYVSRGITGPIQSLAEATREVALGNYDISLRSRSDDETGQLVRSFNRMAKDLKNKETKVKVFTDQLKKSNDELDSRRKYMEVVLRNISAGVLSVNFKGEILSINPSAEKLLNIVATNVLGSHISSVLIEPVHSLFWIPIEERVRGGAVFSGQIEIPLKDSMLTLLADGSRIYDEEGNDLGVVIVFDDASEQVKAQRVAAWREVARRIAHEIKNPITPIKLSAQRLLRRFESQFQGEDRKVFESCINTIVSEVDGLRDLVNEFSKFSRLPGINPKQQSLRHVVMDVIEFYKMSYQEIQFNVEGFQSNLPMLWIDKEQFSRALTNLLSNAIASLEGKKGQGKISMAAEYLVQFQAVRIEIEDNGPGIPERIRSRVLEPYFSTKKDGTGLGLAIVSQIVSDHGGYLRIVDGSEGGTKVVIELPVDSVITAGKGADVNET